MSAPSAKKGKRSQPQTTDQLGNEPLISKIGDSEKEYTFSKVTMRTMVVDAAACIRNDSIKAINTAPLSAVERFNAIALAAKQPIAQEEVFTWIETFEGCLWLLLKSLMPLNKDARQVVAKLDWKTANGLVQMILTHAGWYGDDGDTAPAAEDPTDDAPATEDQPSAGDLASQS